MPKISILCPSFNHKKYVGFFIESVLAQSFQDFELIIVDDYSSDESIKEVEKFTDDRIKLIKHSYNKGINAALNTAFKNSSGDYIVFMASDDIFEFDALEILYKTLSTSDAIVAYPRTLWIDEDNNIIKTTHKEVFQDRIELLHYLFMKGNGLTSNGMMIKKDFCDFLPLANSMCNQQDTQIHINLLLRGKPIFIEKQLVKYRRELRKKGNISSNTLATHTRENLEIYTLMDAFLQCQDIKLLKNVFKEEIKALKLEPFDDVLEFFLGRMALLSDNKERQIWGYSKIMNFYNNEKNIKILRERYNFNFKDYVDIAKYIKQDKTIEKYRKYKKLFNYSLIFSSIIIMVFISILLLG
ncbi:glycosyltransferase family 2 protein [Campylobacter coli]|uniref:Glycosyltransferase family 2 protein n=1 Tax=Campylobacter coli TaxID=195 RepID=A0A5Y7FD42_CAMCO|nr:glycosyltransferase family 2 protein [Campylobacter coli]EAJ6840797.1 glycosyltransferase family 2 protein [Campylobacter coli]ECL0383633.1 glycosyltransferase family 2 protein [Campylobacter coli]EDC2833788.1 glycosyltransferase family 2 protein [Campylobacter coli]EDC2838185.1 glycosyltransferase family 2 protein [Campylobacter coli]